MSRCPTDRRIGHVVLERATTARPWRTDCWDSLRLPTSNRSFRRPGWSHDGADPDSYMAAAEVAAHLVR